QGVVPATTPGMKVYLSDFACFEPTVPPSGSPSVPIKMKFLLVDIVPAETNAAADVFCAGGKVAAPASPPSPSAPVSPPVVEEPPVLFVPPLFVPPLFVPAVVASPPVVVSPDEPPVPPFD